MDRKKLLLLLGALMVAMITSFAARSLMSGAPAPVATAAPTPSGPRVLVAKRPLPMGTIITADAVAYQNWPQAGLQDAYFLEGQTEQQKLLGTVVRTPVTAGQPITRGMLVAPGDRGFLAAALGPGMRAVTIPVSARTGVAGFVFPGDHIDLVLTQTVKGQNETEPLRASETIMRNLRVLATDQSTEQETVEGKTRVHAFSLVTIEVSPKMAEEVAVAQSIGTISLSLRSIADTSADLDQAVASGALHLPRGASPADEERLLKSAMQRPSGAIAEGGAVTSGRATSYVTGGDISRFQRRTMPSEASVNGAVPGAQMAGPPPAPSAPAAPVQHMGPVVRIIRGSGSQDVPLAANGPAPGNPPMSGAAGGH